jgi:NAD(P)-dependent dehydrogenase (short-subunit alcohol dehydrogenase family)
MAKILITGATSKIGRKLSVEFAKKGFDLALHYNKSQDIANELKRKLEAFSIDTILLRADVTKSYEVEVVFDEIEKKIGKVDILINNLGVFPEKIDFKNIREEQWDRIFAINLKSIFLFSQLFAKQNIVSGKIINIASVGGMEHWKGSLLYNVTKSALIHLTKSLAIELAPEVTVNCVSPGIIQSEDSRIVIPETKIPMKKYGCAQDIFNAIMYFIENDYVTGQNLIIDGGYNLKRR